MGGEGSMAAANVSLKQNRNQLRKRKGFKDMFTGPSGETKIEFHKVSDRELSKIKKGIKERAREADIKLFIAFILSILVVMLILFTIFIL